MEEREALAQRLKEVEKHLKKERRSWFLGIWLVYSLIACYLLTITSEVDNVFDLLIDNPLEFFGLLIVSAVLGLVSWWLNAFIWTNCCRSIGDTVRAYKKLENEYNKEKTKGSEKNDSI